MEVALAIFAGEIVLTYVHQFSHFDAFDGAHGVPVVTLVHIQRVAHVFRDVFQLVVVQSEHLRNQKKKTVILHTALR